MSGVISVRNEFRNIACRRILVNASDVCEHCFSGSASASYHCKCRVNVRQRHGHPGCLLEDIETLGLNVTGITAPFRTIVRRGSATKLVPVILIANFDVDSLIVFRTDLNGDGLATCTDVQDLRSVEVSFLRDTIDFFESLIHFLLNGINIRSRIRAVLRLNCQFADPLKVIVNLVQCAFSSLSDRDAIVCVTSSLS